MLDKNLLPDVDRTARSNPELFDHIPIACHYDNDTLLTKNGDLLQVIEITGYEDEYSTPSSEPIRSHINKAITNRISGYNYAVYIHTIRSRKDLMPKGREPFGLADQLNKKWCKKNNWDKQLVNTIYLSVVIQSEIEKGILSGVLPSLFPSKVKKQKFNQLEKACKELQDTVDKILTDLNHFGAHRLTIVKTDKGYVSEPLFLYHYLIHLNQRRTPLPVKDLSEYLSTAVINYHFNTIEVISRDEIQYAAIFTVKNISELPVESLNALLQMGSQFVITQIAYFVPASEAKKKLQKFYDLLSNSQSHICIEKSGLDAFLKSDTKKFSDYCKQQTTILVHSDDVDFFVKKVQATTHIFRQLGIVVIREDFFMPKLFLSQLPGNSRYLENSRLEYFNSKRLGEFCTIHHHMAGSYKGSKWGPPVSLLRTFEGTPFFFNFHNHEGNGNTIMIGPSNAGKTIFKNFLIAQACKLNPRIIYLDYEGVAKDFIEALGGAYYYVGSDESLPLKINPFDIKMYNGEVEYFKQWLIASIFPAGSKQQKYLDFFQVLASKLVEQNNTPDKLNLIKEVIISTRDQILIEGFNNLLGSDLFNRLFTQKASMFGIFDSSNIVGLNLTLVNTNSQLSNVFVGLLLNAVLDILDGHPTIIVYNRLNKIYEMPYFQPLFGNWLDEVNKRNSIAFCSDSRSEALQQNKDFLSHYDKFATKLFLSDKYANKYFKKAFKLDDNELYKVKGYSVDRRMFLFKQDNLSLMLALQLSDLKEELKVLGKSAANN